METNKTIIREYNIKGEIPFNKSENWYENIFSFAEYVYYSVIDYYHNTIRYIKNLILFSKPLKRYYPFDSRSSIRIC